MLVRTGKIMFWLSVYWWGQVETCFDWLYASNDWLNLIFSNCMCSWRLVKFCVDRLYAGEDWLNLVLTDCILVSFGYIVCFLISFCWGLATSCVDWLYSGKKWLLQVIIYWLGRSRIAFLQTSPYHSTEHIFRKIKTNHKTFFFSFKKKN